MTREELVEAARAVAGNAYAPYSRFRVGSAVVIDGGEVFTGSNVENAAFAATSCAEATAIAAAVSSGARRVHTVAVACIDAGEVEAAYPCGRCRQIMAEFGVERVLVTAGEGSEVREHTLEELLPHRFHL